MNTFFNSSNPILDTIVHNQMYTKDKNIAITNANLNYKKDNDLEEDDATKTHYNPIFLNISKIDKKTYQRGLKSKRLPVQTDHFLQIPKIQENDKKGRKKDKHDFRFYQEALLGLKKYILFQWNSGLNKKK